MKRNKEHDHDHTEAKVEHLGPWARFGLAGLAFVGLPATGCTVTLDNGSDAGDGSAQDSGAGNDSSSSDGSATADSGGSADANMPDAAIGDGASATTDGGLGGSCIATLYGTYVQRTDGALLMEGPPEQPVIDSATGLPLAGIVSVQEGQYHGCAAVSGGSAECWQTNSGNGNTSGQLGNGATTATAAVYRATPVLTAVGTQLTKVVAVADGNSGMGCAVTSEGKLWCWGDLTWLVNNGTMLLSGYAQAITIDGTTPLTGVVQAALGPRQACALVQGAPNTVWCWGNNFNDELGQGDMVTRQYPTKVLGFTNPTKLVAAPLNQSGATICALDGANVRCWGSNLSGAAGVNSATHPIQSPTLVLPQTGTSPLGGVDDVRPGLQAFATLRNDHTLWNWGFHAVPYAANYGITNVLAIGWGGGDNLRYITSDGIYHNAMTNVTVNCGAL